MTNCNSIILPDHCISVCQTIHKGCQKFPYDNAINRISASSHQHLQYFKVFQSRGNYSLKPLHGYIMSIIINHTIINIFEIRSWDKEFGNRQLRWDSSEYDNPNKRMRTEEDNERAGERSFEGGCRHQEWSDLVSSWKLNRNKMAVPQTKIKLDWMTKNKPTWSSEVGKRVCEDVCRCACVYVHGQVHTQLMKWLQEMTSSESKNVLWWQWWKHSQEILHFQSN
jgi:hypothetical protein